MSVGLLDYWIARVPSPENEARIVAAVEIARRRTVGNPDATAEETTRRWPRDSSARRPGSGRWAGRASVGDRLGSATPSPLAAASGHAPEAPGFGGDAGRDGRRRDGLFTGGGDVEALFKERHRALSRGHREPGGSSGWRPPSQGRRCRAPRWSRDVAAGEALTERAEDAARRAGNPYIIGAVAIAHGRLPGAGPAGPTPPAERFAVASARNSPRSATSGSGSRRGAISPTPTGAGAASTRPRRSIRRRSTAGSISAIAGPSRPASRTSRISRSSGERPERAARLLGAAEAMREAADAAMAFDEEPEYVASLGRLRAALMTGGVRGRLG